MYPKNRKKKVPHEQYMDYEKVVRRGQTLDRYTMIYDDGWWACSQTPGSLMKKGHYAVAKVPAFRGSAGQRVMGYVAQITVSNKRAYFYKFVFVKEAFCAATALHKAIGGHYAKRWTVLGRPCGWRKNKGKQKYKDHYVRDFRYLRMQRQKNTLKVRLPQEEVCVTGRNG